MAGSRKLQAEIAQVMKKIEEGMSDFDDIWEKVYAAETQSHKERWEAELKKEIKKLQRFRDQIKGWMGSPDIKDKAPLLEARKNVESKMEQFKICERETKTKAYSREGLARAEKVDPRDAEKEEKRTYLNEMTDKLSDLVESIEADYEKLTSSSKKGKNREAAEKMNVRIRKNRWNILKLEQIKRLMDNDELEPSALDEIRDDIDYYLESAVESDHGDSSFEDMVEFNIYEPLNLDTNPITASMSAHLDDGGDDDDQKEEDTKKGKKLSAKQAAKAAAAAAAAAAAPTVTPTKGVAPKSTAAAIAGVVNAAPVVAKGASKVAAVSEKKAAPAPAPAPPPAPVPLETAPSAWGAAKASADNKPTAAAIVAGISSAVTSTSGAAAAPTRAATVSDPVSAAAGMFGGAVAATPDLLRSSSAPDTGAAATNGLSQNLLQASMAQSTGAPSNVVVPPRPAANPLSQDLVSSLNMLNCSMSLLPQQPSSSDGVGIIGDRGKFVPRTPYACHQSFPSSQPAGSIIENPKLFERLSYDTLFLAFYYQQGSYQQYLAAKQLKKHSWRYHRKYMTWFQRHEEPKSTTDEYEEGTYVYFDYENGWCQRIKPDFKFEYAYLEDEL